MREIKNPKSKILVYGVPEDSPEAARLAELAAEKDIQLQKVKAEDFSQTLGAVAGLDGYALSDEKYEGEKPQHSILWFVSVDRETLMWFLNSYKAAKGLRPVALKSVLTEHNVKWKLIDHYEELKSEHQFMRAYTLLSHARGALELVDPEKFSDSSYRALSEAVDEGDHYIALVQKGEEVDPDTMDEAARKVKEAYENLRPRVK